MARIPAEVRQARALLTAGGTVGVRRAAEATALLSTDLRAPGGDLTSLARSARDGGAAAGTWRAEARRLERAAAEADRTTSTAPATGAVPLTAAPATGATLTEAVALVTALARPEWIARRRGPAPAAGPSGASPPGSSATTSATRGSACQAAKRSGVRLVAMWAAICSPERKGGQASGKVRAARAARARVSSARAGRTTNSTGPRAAAGTAQP